MKFCATEADEHIALQAQRKLLSNSEPPGATAGLWTHEWGVPADLIRPSGCRPLTLFGAQLRRVTIAIGLAADEVAVRDETFMSLRLQSNFVSPPNRIGGRERAAVRT
jgi:hypothetical protein